MRSRLLVSSLLALSTMAATASLLSAQSDSFADGLTAGEFLRVSGGSVSPINAQGSLRDWSRGNTASVVWETWGGTGGGPGLLGFGLGADYSRLPLNERQFLTDYTTPAGAPATSATASSATAFSIETSIRVRIPAPFIMPSVSLGLGYLDYHPATIDYTSASGSGTATQQHRRGAAFTLGAGLDKHIVQRFALFGEALYTYGFTSLGQGLATPGGTCASNGCDVLKNTSLGTIRGGLRLQIGQ
jgi:hypothetical protein